MNFKIIEFVPNPKIIGVYTYVVCDSDGKTISNPAFDFLQALHKESPQDAQILKSQIENTAYLYGIIGRNEKCKGRESLYAIPSKYDEGKRITSRYRMYYWILGSVIIIGGGCYKPEKIDGIEIRAYQEVPDCEKAAAELCEVSKIIEELEKSGEIFIFDMEIDIDKEEILSI